MENEDRTVTEEAVSIDNKEGKTTNVEEVSNKNKKSTDAKIVDKKNTSPDATLEKIVKISAKENFGTESNHNTDKFSCYIQQQPTNTKDNYNTVVDKVIQVVLI